MCNGMDWNSKRQRSQAKGSYISEKALVFILAAPREEY